MIFDSVIYKEELLTLTEHLGKIKESQEFTTDDLMTLEKDLLFSFFIIRCLIEMKTKLSEEVIKKQYSVTEFPCINPPNVLNRYDFSDNYDLDHGKCQTIQTNALCNQIIHSYIFHISVNEQNYIDGIYFVSDYDRVKKLYFLSLDTMINILQDIGNDSVDKISYKWDAEIDEYQVITSTSNNHRIL